MTNEAAAVWFEARLKNIAMPGAREMHKMAISALRAQSSSEKPNNWIRVEDRLPEPKDMENITVLTCRKSMITGRSVILDIARWNGADWVCKGKELAHVTHWQPLPEPPKGE